MPTPILATPLPTFKPSMRIVTAITQAFPAQVTTSFDHGYITGLIVRIDIPLGVGMPQINQLFGAIVVNGLDTFLIDIDTRLFDPLNTITIGGLYQYPQAVPIGEVNGLLAGAVQNVLPYRSI